MSLIRKHVAVLQAWACLALVDPRRRKYVLYKKNICVGQFNRLREKLFARTSNSHQL